MIVPRNNFIFRIKDDIMFKILLLSLIFFCHYSFAQSSIDFTGSKIKTKDAQEILDHHNKIRKDLGVEALSWSPKLSAYAQAWAEHLSKSNNCEIEHRTQCGENGKTYGENIFWGSSAEYYKPIQASLSWFSEVKYYSYRKLNENNWHKAGHYTQMIWKDTKEMGVGVAICSNGSLIVVANYYPAGNYIGQYPY
jgi:pathogenesis-related protein 1